MDEHNNDEHNKVMQALTGRYNLILDSSNKMH